MKLFTASDQYYVVTSQLAARGHQQSAMRVVAGSILILSAPPLLALTNPTSTRVGVGPAALAGIAVACIAMASLWLRHRWPTRAQSSVAVIIGALALASGCIVATDPLAGLLIATAFVFPLGYAVLFHGSRIQAFTAALSALTVLWLAVRIAVVDLPTAVAVSLPVLLVNVVVAYACRTIAELTAVDSGPTDLEPLTGLLTRQSFDESAGTLLGSRNRDDDRYLVVAVVVIDSFAALLSVQGSRGADRARIEVAQALRDTVRRDTVIGHVDDAEFLVADIFTAPDPTPLAERIRGAVAATPGGITVSIGIVSTPLRPLAGEPPSDVLDEAIARATTAMFQARRRGGNCVECVFELDGS